MASADGGMHPTHQFTGTSATHHEDHMIRVPDDAHNASTTTVEEHGVQQGCCKACINSVIFKTLAVVVLLSIVAAAAHEFLNPPAEYSAAVSAITDGPGATAAAPPRVARRPGAVQPHRPRPDPGRVGRECVAGGSAAWVWYNGTVIADGDVPPFCAGKRRKEEVVVPLSGVVVDAPLTWLPPPGEMQRTGAVVDLAIWMASYNKTMGCRVRVGGGLSVFWF